MDTLLILKSPALMQAAKALRMLALVGKFLEPYKDKEVYKLNRTVLLSIRTGLLNETIEGAYRANCKSSWTSALSAGCWPSEAYWETMQDGIYHKYGTIAGATITDADKALWVDFCKYLRSL
jgi:hypothetical protein